MFFQGGQLADLHGAVVYDVVLEKRIEEIGETGKALVEGGLGFLEKEVFVEFGVEDASKLTYKIMRNYLDHLLLGL